MKNVLFFVESLGGGGAEKVLATVIRHIDKTRFNVTVCSIVGGGVYERDISSQVSYKNLLYQSAEDNFFKKLVYKVKYHLIYKFLPLKLVYAIWLPKGNDVEVAFVEGFSTKLIASSTNKNAKKIAWVHCDLENQPWTIEKKVFKNRREEMLAYQSFNQVICVSKIVENVMRNVYLLDKVKTIYNPLDEVNIKVLSQQPCDVDVNKSSFNIVAVGRLTAVKGYDRLLKIFAKLVKDLKSVHLWLIGDGEEKHNLEELCKNLGVEKQVSFMGFLSNPYALMSRMNLFVCSSQAEGFSLVLAESMLLNVPVVSFDCAGPKEILQSSNSGYICKTEEEMLETIKNIISGKIFPNVKYPSFLSLKKSMMDIEKILG